jgi:hypothetical protein
MARTLPFLPLEVTEEEARTGFRIMILDLHSYFGLGDGIQVVARKVSDTDVLIKIRATSSKRGLHDFYEHIRFGFVSKFLRMRWPWTKVGWQPMRWCHYDHPDSDLSRSLATPHVIGTPFPESRWPGASERALDHIMKALSGWAGRAKIASVLLVMLIVIGAALMFLSKGKSTIAPKVAILDPRLKILSAQMLSGNKRYYMPHDGNMFVGDEVRWASSLEGEVRSAVHRMGLNVDTLTPLRPGKGLGGRAFCIYYAFPESATSSLHLVAELVAQDGTLYPLRSVAGARGSSPESWNVWTLDSAQSVGTNYALRLKTETDGTPVAELKFT